MARSGEHTPPACGFRRRAENIVPQTSSRRKFPEWWVTKVRARRPNSHAGRVRSRSCFGLKQRLARLVPAVHRAMQKVKERVERQHAEKKREEYSRKFQVLSRWLVEPQETERRHLARELHDEIGQALTVAQLNLQALLPSPGTKTLVPRLQESLEVVEHVLEQLHDISLNLRPSMLDDLGLEPASGGLHAVAMDRKSSFFLAPH